ncbi:MAG: DUF4157 domain-containing protein [Verrucomicrobiota bacterium]
MKAPAAAKQSVTPATSGGAFFNGGRRPPQPTFFTTGSGSLQTALTVSQPGDAHELEAEKMADRVTAGRDTPFFRPAAGLQRQAEISTPEEPREIDRSVDEDRSQLEETEDKPPAIQRRGTSHSAPLLRIPSPRRAAVSGRAASARPLHPIISRSAASGRCGGRAARIDPSRARGPPAVSSDFENQLRSSKGGGKALPAHTRVEMESSFGADFSGVRVHDGAGADRLSRNIEAQAFTHGQDIYFARNRYQPADREGRHLLAHELTHVIQQGGGIREGVRRSPKISSAPTALQRFPTSIAEARQDINSLVENLIPGYALATVLIGYNPILGQNVAWSASAFFRGAAGLIPGGVAVYDKLNAGGAINDAFAWIMGEMAARNLTWGRVSGLWDAAWDRMSIWEGISGNVQIFCDTFSGFFSDVGAFIGAVVDRLTAILKDLAIAAVRALFGSDGPAYDMITMVIGQDPLTGEPRTWVTVDFLRAALNFFGFGSHVAKMDETGQLQNAADWLDQQFGILSGAVSGLVSGITGIWDSLGLAALANPLEVLTRTVGVVTGFVRALLEFVGNLAAKILELIKEIVISLAREYAHRIPGYRLFTVIIGVDPVTGEGVPRTAMNFVHGFLEFVPNGAEIYQNLAEGNAIGKAMDWLTEQAAQLGPTPGAIVQRFTELWTNFSIDDLMNPLGAFERVAGVFLGFIGDVLTLAGRIALKLLEILFEVVMGGGGTQVLAILKEAQGAFDTIVADPVEFVGNLVNAAKLGFTQFASNILEHLRTGLLGWLFGALEGAGIQMPATFDLRGILSLALQILGLTYAQIRPQLVEQLGEPTVAHLETAFEVVRILLTEGLAGIWSRITEFLTVSLPDMVIGAIRNFVMERIVAAAVTRIASMLNPAGAVIQAILAVYNTVMFFIERMNQMMATVQSFVQSIARIAAGDIASAADAVEQTMARTLPVIISFLARLLGLGGISEKIREIIKKIQAPIQAALGRVIGWIVAQARRMGRGVLQAGTGNMTPQEKLDRGMELAVSAVNRFRGRAVAEAVLVPLLAGIATRYDFQYLRVVPQDGLWVVSGKVNPGENKKSGAKVGTYADPERLLVEARNAAAAEVGAGVTPDQVPAIAEKVRSDILGRGAEKVLTKPAPGGGIAVSFHLNKRYFPVGNLRRTLGRDPAHRTVRSETRIQLVSGHPISNLSEILPRELPAGGLNPTVPTGTGGRTGVVGNEIQLLTWNTSPMERTGGSHAEAHVSALLSSAAAAQLLQYVESIVIRNFSFSACTSCSDGLIGSLHKVLAAQRAAGGVVLKRAEIYWTKRYGNSKKYIRLDSTSWTYIEKLADAGWTIHAPASAMPDPSGAPNAVEEAARRRPLSQQVVVIAGTIQRQPDEETSASRPGRIPGGQTGERDFQRRLHATRGSGRPLEPVHRAFFESRFGHDFSAVRIHGDAPAADLANRIHALAFTRGRDIYFSNDRYAPGSAAGRHLLAHELTHVIQQGAAPPLAGSVSPTEPDTDMKIRPTFRRSARRVSRRAPDAPFFQAEAPEAPFFTPTAGIQPELSAENSGSEPEKEIQPKREDEVQAKPEEEELQVKLKEDAPDEPGCSCGGTPT